jgi:hypothetical protein
MLRKLILVSLAVAVASFAITTSSSAKEVEKGSAFLSIEFAHGTADLIAPEVFTTGSVSAYDHSEWGGQVMYQYLISENWAIAPSFGIGMFKETDEPGTNALPGTTDFEYKQSSWNVRLGLDRFVNVGDGFALFAGPGIEVWSGKAKFTQDPNEEESEDVSRISLNGRLGAHVAIGESFGLTGYLGHYIGHASGDDTGAKATWWPSGTNGAMGFSFHF